MSKRKRKAMLVILIVIILLAALSLYVFEYTTPGYRMTIAMHGFTQLADRIYVDQNWHGDTTQLLSLVGEARERVRSFFGELKSHPYVIICDDKQKLARLGGDHDTFTLMLFQTNSYIAISSEWLNTDVLAHEFTHAEVHTRIFRGGISFELPIPTWFDEGLAIQNDYREQYSNQTWLQITDNGAIVPSVYDYDTAAKFYAGDTEDRRKRYCFAGHEVSAWIDQYGKDALITLLYNVSKGVNFSNQYIGNQTE
jgi:hypothetical protein